MLKVRVKRRAVELAITKRNMSQNMLAMRMSSSSGYISQLIRGVRYPSPEMRQRMLEVLAPMTFDDVFIIEEDQNESADQ